MYFHIYFKYSTINNKLNAVMKYCYTVIQLTTSCHDSFIKYNYRYVYNLYLF